MPTPTYTAIASTTLASSASSVTFSSLDTIAAGYRDLIVVTEIKGDAANVTAEVQFNGDTGANYYLVFMYSDGTATSFSQTTSSIRMGASSATTTQASFGILQVMDFSATDKHKSCLVRSAERETTVVTSVAGRWASTSAITSLTIKSPNNYAAGSTFSLYGIAA